MRDARRHVTVELHHRDSSRGSASTEPHAESPVQQSPPQPIDPLMQEREEFKAALLATHKMTKTPVRPNTASMPP